MANKIGVSTEEWLAELERLGRDSKTGEDAFTTEELSQKLGKGPLWVRAKLRDASRKGLIEFVKKQTMNLCGQLVWVPAYRPKKRKSNGK